MNVFDAQKMLEVLMLLAIVICSCEKINLSRRKVDLRKRLFYLKFRTKSGMIEKNCSIEESSYVHHILMHNFYPIFEEYNATVPSKCPFEKSRNIYNDVEKNKVEDSNYFVKCDFCGKLFYKEKYFYEHILRKHSDMINRNRRSICLADYCDIFRCDLHLKYSDIDKKVCSHKEVRKLQRKCEKAMSLCLPTQMSHYVYDDITNFFCSALTCDKYHVPFESLTVLRILMYTLVTCVTAVFLIIFCCAFIDTMDSNSDEVSAESIRNKNADLATWRSRYYHNNYELRHRHR